MKLITGEKTYEINSYAKGKTQVSFDIQGDITELKEEFSNVSEISITNDDGEEIAAFKELSFKSATIFTDGCVTVTLTFPEVTTESARLSEVEENVKNIDEILSELLFGAEETEE